MPKLQNNKVVHFDSEWGEATFYKLQSLLNLDAGVFAIEGIEYSTKDPWFATFLPNYQRKGDMIKYQTIAINPEKYLNWLEEQYVSKGGKIVMATISHINECFSENVDIVINCSGLGSKTLGGVCDSNVFATSGQVILVEAPHINRSVSRFSDATYVIPRGNGTVVLGGTFQEDNYDVEPDKNVRESILKRCQEICPELAPFKIINEWVGLRPSRRGGVRIESEQVVIGHQVKKIIHLYGHSGSGFQSSWATVRDMIQLIN